MADQAIPPLVTDEVPAPRALPKLLVRRRRGEEARGFFARLRIRKKLMLLHTLFSLGMAGILLVAVRPALREVVYRAELQEARMLLDLLGRAAQNDPTLSADDLARMAAAAGRPVQVGSPVELGLGEDIAARATVAGSAAIEAGEDEISPRAVLYMPGLRGASGDYIVAEGRSEEARGAVLRLYVLVSVALLAVYAMVALALELFILPQHVYAPIRRLLAADLAVREERTEEELIDPRFIPADELGEIMRSRNEAVLALRVHQRRLAEAIDDLNDAAVDLKRKNHLLETAQRNLADADRLASLGMMSAGIAHELNTPLAVLKGLVERLDRAPERGVDAETSALMVRVVGRLERLGESLLDFARVRPPHSSAVVLRYLVEEAITLVRLDRQTRDMELEDQVAPEIVVDCDAMRMVQVFVNLIRNSVDAVRSGRLERLREMPGDRVRKEPGRIVVGAEHRTRDGAPWVTMTIRDNGPGIEPSVLPRLFEPFVSTRLDSKGTGLGLAVAEGIVREHGGVILARNRADGGGAEFEIMLPARASQSAEERAGA
ncbi:MAG: hypothetical protein IT435_01385 [Phycisphaerales bacterium]|nr:hypothetical protein [Phycisphaerales bacterium]